MSESLTVSTIESRTEIRPDIWDWVLSLTIVATLVIGTYFSLRSGVYDPILHFAQTHRWGRFIVKPSVMWTVLGSILLTFRTFMWFGYRPARASTYEEAPSLTVIIPAYNEGPMVSKTIDSVLASLYPRDRIEVFVVDDGSRDDTWTHIERAAGRYPGLVTTVRFERNRGKRAALEAGFRAARGEIVVTIDSDSVIETDTLLAIAGPFREARVGAVAGRVGVFNKEDGLIPRMLHVRFILAFDLLRAAQSAYGTVFCCPGALTAFRASVVAKVLDRWMNQTFLGVPCTYGEDRAITNLILAEGFDTVYQRTARVHTVVPRTYDKLCKMYLRWDRSYIREEIEFYRIVWRRPWKSKLLALFETGVTNLRYPVTYACLALLIASVFSDPTTILRVLLGIGIMALTNMLYYLKSERSGDFIYGVIYAYFAFFGLVWIFPWALVTVRSRSWMTR